MRYTPFAAAAVLAALSGTASAQEAVLGVDSAQSEVDLTATLQIVAGTRTDSDTSPLAGTMRVELDSYTEPTSITINSFSLVTLESIDFLFDYSFLGSITATLPILMVSSPMDALPTTGMVLQDGSFIVENVPAQATGVVTIGGTGIVGSPFAGTTVDLATLSQPPVTITGTVEIASGTVTLTSVLPLDGTTTDPTTGTTITLAGQSTLVATGDVPEPECIADTNGDGVLSPADFSAWIAAFNAMSPACDQNGDSACTPADFSAWIANYNAGC